MKMETDAQVSTPSWLPLKSSLPPLAETLYFGQSHQQQQLKGPLTATPRSFSESLRSPSYPRFSSIPQPPLSLPVQEEHPVVMNSGDHPEPAHKSRVQESPVVVNGAYTPRTTPPPSVQENSMAVDDTETPQRPTPRRFPSDNFDFVSRGTWTDEKEKTIRNPYDYIASQPGKEFRTLLLNSLNAWLEVPEPSLTIITNVVRMLHTASLLIDDIQDGSALRRGLPTAHKVFGVAQTINAGNYVYFLALRELEKLNNPAAAIDIYTTEMLYLHRGQGMELYWRDTLACPTEDDYLEMVSHKTGGLFRLAVKLMQSESSRSVDCMPLVHLLGLIFQIADDYRNLSNLDYTLKKGLCEDLTEGKFSFPVIHSIHSDPANTQLLHILAQKPTEVEIKRSAVQYIESTGSLEYTRKVVEELIDRAKVVAEGVDQGRGRCQGIYKVLEKLSLT